MPVGSQGTVKTLTPEELKDMGIAIVLSNAYHLYLRPGIDTVERVGGLHRFMAWDGPILTDSGGYQVFSLSRLRRVTDEGVIFRSHIDGSEHFLTPRSVVEAQERLGADIIMALDECTAHNEDADKAREAMERTHRWAEKCLRHHRGSSLIYGIVQGGVFPELRRQSAAATAALGFDGYAIGGLSLGEPKELTWLMVDEVMPFLPEDRPRYLMGVGSPEDIVEGVSRGIDLFDSALPTRVARNGALFTREGRQNIRNADFRLKDQPVDFDCDCYMCRTFSLAYLHHLFKCEELLAYRLATIHNLRFITRLLEDVRCAVERRAFPEFKQDFLSHYRVTDEEIRLAQKRKWLSTARRSGNSSTEAGGSV